MDNAPAVQMLTGDGAESGGRNIAGAAMLLPDRNGLTAATSNGFGGDTSWSDFFGGPQQERDSQPYDRYPYEKEHLPRAYIGQNKMLRDVLEGLILRGGPQAEWPTTVGLPWAQTDQLKIMWNEFTFNRTLAGRVPHEGLSRLVTTSKRTREGRIVRRGLAMMLEHGFAKTAEGIETYRRQLVGIKNAVQETQNFDVINAYLNCHQYERDWMQKAGRFPTTARELRSALCSQWACVQKSSSGIDILHEQLKKTLRARECVPDLWVFPSKMTMYLSMVHPERTNYYIAGPQGVLEKREGPAAYSKFRGCNVFESHPFDISDTGPAVDMLRRRRMTGEYYRMYSHLGDTNDDTQFRKHWRDIIIYNEAVDNWSRITFKAALTHSNRFSEKHRLWMQDDVSRLDGFYRFKAGVASDVDGRTIKGEVLEMFTMFQFAGHCNRGLFGEPGLRCGRQLAAATGAATLPAGMFDDGNTAAAVRVVSLANMCTLLDLHIDLPFEVVLFRPFIQHWMCSAILTKGGYDTGATFYGKSDFMLGDDAQSKVHIGNFTFYSKALVTNPRNVAIAQDIFADGYVGGNNVKFHGRGSKKMANYVSGEMDAAESEASLPSLYSCLLLAHAGRENDDNGPLDTDSVVRDMLGSPAAANQATGFEGDAGALKWARATEMEFYDETYQWRQLVGRSAEDSARFQTAQGMLNTVCFQGHQWMFSGGDGANPGSQFNSVVLNTGAWGPDVYPGCGRVRAGEMKYFEEKGYHKTANTQCASYVWS